MKNILVSGASGIIGYGILRSLRLSGNQYKLIGTTIYSDSAAEGFCDIFEQAIPTNDPNYIDWLLKTIEKHQIDLIIPGIEADMYAWAEHVETLQNTSVKVLLNTKELIEVCHDKWVFYEKLKATNSPFAIDTTLDSDFNTLQTQFGLPLLLKPRVGHGSKGIVKVNSKEEFDKHQQYIGSQLMVQPIVGTDDEEYTTSAFCDGNGGFYAYMTLKRKLSKDGFTEKAEVVALENIEEALHALCQIFQPIGPTNFQFRKDKDGLKLLEINPRISSSTSIRAKFGYNESQMAVDYFLEGKAIEQPVIKKGKAIRYIEDQIIYE
ncbi:ATP-grasp domain-containing protein [Flavobacterium sp.]|uniref:ATP-grasp domain-containing protein n=1 Tax=Flavobacterium sp. TaxID=239 RepID=UPI00286B33EB|nr:ATP-grasp domain-containing protein [Flavobacterium sp.]